MTTILDRIAERLGYVAKTQTISDSPEWLQATGNAQRFSVPELWLPENQLQFYEKLSWIAIAVNAVASSGATTALSVKKMVGEDKQDISNHEFETLLQRPNPLQSRYEFLESTISYRAVTGNAYWWLNRTSEKQKPSEIWVLSSNRVRPVPDGRLFLRGYLYDPGDGTEIPLEPWEVVHFKRWHPRNSFVGLSPIEALATVAKGDLAMQRWNTNFFGEGNAKVPGALAFADPIDDSSWQRMREDIKREHGGTKRNLMMLRNVGKGGVEWVSMAMSQKDMEFLNARDKTKEEIFAMYAPGLASILAINATEANSTAGRATFNELAVWPQLTAIAEKITNDVLISYGDNLKAEFDDIRGSDKAMDMAEQNVYALTHTIDEVRQRYYGDTALGDERGTLLVAQVGQATGKAEQPGQAEPMADMPEETKPPTEREEEVAKFQRWAAKKKNPNPDRFESDILTRAEKAAILAGMEDASGGTMSPFLPTDGSNTRKNFLDADTDGELERRAAIERRAERRIAKGLATQQERILSGVPQTPDDFAEWAAGELERSLQNGLTEAELEDALRRALIESVDLGISVAVAQFDNIGFGFDWTLANEDARRWADQHAGKLIRDIDATSIERVRRSVAAWVANGEPLERLIEDLSPIFGRGRAELIASTEVTRAYAEANRIAYKQSGVVTRWQWRTSEDERVCPICGPLADAVIQIDGDFSGFLPDEVRRGMITIPPSHPRCRCWVVPFVEN